MEYQNQVEETNYGGSHKQEFKDYRKKQNEIQDRLDKLRKQYEKETDNVVYWEQDDEWYLER